MKEKTPQQQLNQLRTDILWAIRRWNHLNEVGGQDPFWPDGCNMNLERNHVLYAKQRIRDLCGETGLAYPEEYYLATPPEVDNGYMASTKQTDRMKRLREQGMRIATGQKNEYDPEQASLFDLEPERQWTEVQKRRMNNQW